MSPLGETCVNHCIETWDKAPESAMGADSESVLCALLWICICEQDSAMIYVMAL